MKKLVLPLLLFALTASGCASHDTKPNDRAALNERTRNDDPMETANRGVYRFNVSADKAILKPVAIRYKKATKGPVKKGISNFFQNLSEPRVTVNSFLQGKLNQGMISVVRFTINSTFGIGGLIDVAGYSGAPYHDEDFGQTLGVWGWKKSDYVMMPILGPSTVRDTIGQIVDFFSDPLWYYHDRPTQIGLYVLKVVDTRANALGTTDILNTAAGEQEYQFVREAYKQHRDSEIRDGKPKLEGLEFIEDN
ncbi:MAG: MlaA family lipoprotein [Acidiferrobacterales bacterium]